MNKIIPRISKYKPKQTLKLFSPKEAELNPKSK